MVKMRKNLVPEDLIPKSSYGKGNKKKRICIHETDNVKVGSDADAHSRLQKNGNSRKASWHWQVDDQEAVQSFEHEIRCWAAGNGNHEAIHIEMCVNADSNYIKTVQNTAALVAHIMKIENISLENVVQHNYYTGKNCPSIMRKGNIIPWSTLIQMIKGATDIAKEITPATDKVLYRLFTGTFKNQESAENALDVLKYRFGWTCYLDSSNGGWRVKTGTFAGRAAADKGAEKIKLAKIASVVHIKEA